MSTNPSPPQLTSCARSGEEGQGSAGRRALARRGCACATLVFQLDRLLVLEEVS